MFAAKNNKMEILISLVMFTLLFSTIKSRVTESNDGILEEVRVGLVVDMGSVEGKLLKTSFTLALSDFYRINGGYRTRVSVLVSDSRGDPLLALAAGEFHFLYCFLFSCKKLFVLLICTESLDYEISKKD